MDKAQHIARLKQWALAHGWKHWSGGTIFHKCKHTPDGVLDLQMEFGVNQLQILRWSFRSRKTAERTGKPFGPYKRPFKWAFYSQLEITPAGKLRGLQNAEE